VDLPCKTTNHKLEYINVERGNTVEKPDPGKLELIASHSLSANEELVRLVDFLNKNLKFKNILFGITKDKNKKLMTINVYEFR
jgi:hypothetical protein